MERPDAFESVSQEYLGFITSYLGGSVEDISTDYDLFKDSAGYNEEEMWTIPKEFEEVLVIDNLHSPTFSWGYVVFGTYKGIKVIIEQNASPILVYWNRNNLEI
jgi:hypothetical protein